MNTSREDLGQYRKPSVHTMKKLVESFSRTSFDDSFGPESNQDHSFNYYQQQEMNNSGYSQIDNQDFYHPPEKHISQAALRTINRPTMDLAQDPPKVPNKHQLSFLMNLVKIIGQLSRNSKGGQQVASLQEIHDQRIQKLTATTGTLQSSRTRTRKGAHSGHTSI